MEKHTLSHYGWIVILIVILCMLVSLATPFGTYVKDSALTATRSFVNLTYNALGLQKPLADGSYYFAVDNAGTLIGKPLYVNTSLRETKDNLDELGLSKNTAREWLACNMFTGVNFSVDDWKKLGISNSNLELIAKNFILNEVDYDTVAIKEMTNNSNCTTFRQAVLNCVYDFSEKYINGTNTRSSTQNVTEEELDQLWRAWAAVAYEEIIDDLNTVSSDTDIAINILAASNIGLENIASPSDESEITKELIYDANKSMLQPKLYLDIFYSAAEAVIYNTDSLSYRDIIGLFEPLFYLFSIDELAAMLNNEGADVDKASTLGLDGFTISEQLDLVYEGGTLPASFEIPSEIYNTRVVKITQNTGFIGNEHLFEIRLPESIYSIGTYSFSGCTSLSSINLENVTSLGSYAFKNCKNLKEIELSQYLKTIPAYCFQNCISLEEVVINDGTTTISDNAFYGCTSLKKIVIPSSVTTIGTNAFYGCSSKLIIYGEPGSYAETFATSKGIAFVSIDSL